MENLGERLIGLAAGLDDGPASQALRRVASLLGRIHPAAVDSGEFFEQTVSFEQWLLLNEVDGVDTLIPERFVVQREEEPLELPDYEMRAWVRGFLG